MHRLPPSLALAVLLAAPLEAQIGLASNTGTVVLSARKVGSVRVGLAAGNAADLPGSLEIRWQGETSVPIETAWDLDPAQPAAVSVVVYVRPPETRRAEPGGPLLLFTQPVGANNAAGRRTDHLVVRVDAARWPDPSAGEVPETLNLLAITQ